MRDASLYLEHELDSAGAPPPLIRIQLVRQTAGAQLYDRTSVSASRSHAQPFTAAAVKPLMKYFWKNANSTAIGSVAMVDAAMAAAHSGGRE